MTLQSPFGPVTQGGTGTGLPAGGTAGQYLEKQSSTDGDASWVDLTTFLADPDNIDESDATYFYFGWLSVSGGWLIQRQVRATAATTSATVSNNSGVPDLATAWPLRATLTYS